MPEQVHKKKEIENNKYEAEKLCKNSLKWRRDSLTTPFKNSKCVKCLSAKYISTSWFYELIK